MSIEIFPHSLVRYAGMDYRKFNGFKLVGAREILEKQQQFLSEKAKLKLLICDKLYDLITAQTDEGCRQKLINLKRQVYNDKKIAVEKLEELAGLFPAELALALKSYLFLVQSITGFHAANRINFQQQLNEQHRKLQQLALDPSLQNGLLLSSPVLLEQLSGYQKKDPEHFRQKEHRMAFSLLRYLTRMSFKTSPFSTFTYTGIMRLSGEQRLTAATLSSRPVQHKIRLNNGLFEYLKSLLLHHPGINEFMTVRLNKTATISAQKIHFLINFNNIESFQLLPATGLPLFLFRYFKQEKPLINFAQLIEQVANQVENKDFPTVKNYLFKLVAAGLLELGMETSGINPKWDVHLLNFFQGIQNKHSDMDRLIQLFEQLQQHKLVYAEGNTTARRSVLEAAENQVAQVLKELQATAGLSVSSDAGVPSPASKSTVTFETINFKAHHFSGRQLLYEDCYTAIPEFLNEILIKEFTEKADQLLNHLIPLDLLKAERQKMTRFFLEYYPENASVNVIDFYHDYYLQVKKPEKEQAATGIPAKASLGEWEKAVSLKLSVLTADQPGCVNLNNDFFSALTPLNSQKVSPQYSRGLFVQFYEEKQVYTKNQTRPAGTSKSIYGVINAVLPGMGKVSGRFLPLFSAEVTDDFVAHNARLYPDVIKAELNDASSFNANVHPPLLNYELALPGGNKSYPEKQQIQIENLQVSFDKKTDFLKLSYGEKQVYAYDLSLESFYNRSNLYQLMAHFNAEEKLFLAPFIHLVDAHYLKAEEEQVEEIRSLPRITYENSVIIRRKTWRIKTSAIPLQQASESDYDYFVRINDWRFEHGLPTNIFLFLRKRSFIVKTTVGNGKKDGLNDDYKPQFISFEQPLLIDLLKRLLSRAGDYLILEEMLPELPDEEQTEPVKEYLLQWYKY